jgi:acyl carrier protein
MTEESRVTATPNTPSRPKQEIADWLIDWIAKELKMSEDDIEPARSLIEYRLDSLTATILVGDLEDWLELRLPPSLVWDYPSIDAMTDYLVEQAAGKDAAPASPAAVGTGATQDAKQLLDSLDQLSDEEVDALLSRYVSSELSGD